MFITCKKGKWKKENKMRMIDMKVVIDPKGLKLKPFLPKFSKGSMMKKISMREKSAANGHDDDGATSNGFITHSSGTAAKTSISPFDSMRNLFLKAKSQTALTSTSASPDVNQVTSRDVNWIKNEPTTDRGRAARRKLILAATEDSHAFQELQRQLRQRRVCTHGAVLQALFSTRGDSTCAATSVKGGKYNETINKGLQNPTVMQEVGKVLEKNEAVVKNEILLKHNIPLDYGNSPNRPMSRSDFYISAYIPRITSGKGILSSTSIQSNNESQTVLTMSNNTKKTVSPRDIMISIKNLLIIEQDEDSDNETESALFVENGKANASLDNISNYYGHKYEDILRRRSSLFHSAFEKILLRT